MSSTSRNEQLIARMLAGDLPADEAARLGQLLSEDPALRAEYHRQVMMHSMLQWRHGRMGQPDRGEIDPIAVAGLLAEAEQAARLSAEQEAAEHAKHVARSAAELRRRIEQYERENRPRRPQPIEIPYAVAYAGIAVVAASMLWIGLMLFQSYSTRSVEDELAAVAEVAPVESHVASISGSVEAQLVKLVEPDSEGESVHEMLIPLADGTRLAAGQYLLNRGVVSFQFDGGASAVLESPASIELVSADRVTITHGRLVGKVPPEAIGFTVAAPNAKIIDLGTEFGISIDDNQSTDVSVFDGEVEVVAAAQEGHKPEEPTARRRLTRSNSVRVDVGGQFVPAETRELDYFREVPTLDELRYKRRYSEWVEYTDALAEDSDVVAYYTFNRQQLDDSRLQNHVPESELLSGDIQGAQWEEGRWAYKQALRFAGVGQLESDFPRVELDIPGRYRQLTLAVWVYLDELPAGLTGLLMAESWSRPGQIHWQIGSSGRPHLGIVPSDNVGRTFDAAELRETMSRNLLGKWTHIAVVADLEADSIAFFVDGSEVGTHEAISDAEGGAPDALQLGEMWIGAWHVGNRPENQTAYRGIHGKMDELLILGRALSPRELNEMYMVGSP